MYIIKRKKQNKISNREKCNYVANKSGTVKSIKVQKGVLLVQENNYVTKGDVLISGDIFYNEELKDQVCAKGTIKGEVWYKVNVNYPLYITKTMNEKSKYNISFNFLDNNYYMFNNKYPKIIKSRGIGNNKFGINVMKNIKEKKIHKRIKYNEALEKSLDIAKEKVLKKTYNKGQIIDENVLKKEIKNDKIIVEVLVTVEEELGIIEKL